MSFEIDDVLLVGDHHYLRGNIGRVIKTGPKPFSEVVHLHFDNIVTVSGKYLFWIKREHLRRVSPLELLAREA